MCLTTHWLDPLIAIVPQEKIVLTVQKIRVVTRHKYGVSSRVTLRSFRGEASGDVAKRRLFFRQLLQKATAGVDYQLQPVVHNATMCKLALYLWEGGFSPPAAGLEAYAVFPGQRSFSNRTGTSVDDRARKSNNWLDQWLRGKLCTGSRV